MDYSLQVNIHPTALNDLRQAGYKLCIAKRVNYQYNVVWSGNGMFLGGNVFNWQESYQVFGTQVYQPGIVKPFTPERDIAFGQTCVLVGNDMFPATGTPDDSGTFYVQDRRSDLGVGVNCSLHGSYSPIFVTEFPFTGLYPLTPTTTLLVWFDRQLTTGANFFNRISNGREVHYAPGTTSHTVFFDGKWSIVDELGQAIAQPTRSIGFKDSGDQSDVVPAICALLSDGTHLALDRDANSKMAVVGDKFKEGSPDQEWILIASTTEGYFNIEGASRGTYLSIDGEPTEGTPVIHGPTKMDWKVEPADGDVRISVPDTDYCVKLGGIISPDSEKKGHKIKLAKRAHEKKELWTIHYLPPDDTAEE